MNAVELRDAASLKRLPKESVTALGRNSLRNQTVTLGPLLPEDLTTIFLWLNDTEAAALDLAFRPLDWTGYVAWLADLGKNPTRVLFAIRSALEPRILGFLTLSNIHQVHRSGELGLRIGAEAERGRGYGKAATALALDYAFDHLNLNRVHLTVFAHNTRAIRAYEATGFEVEGRLRRAAFIQGQWVDVLLMAALNPASRPVLRSVESPPALELEPADA